MTTFSQMTWSLPPEGFTKMPQILRTPIRTPWRTCWATGGCLRWPLCQVSPALPACPGIALTCLMGMVGLAALASSMLTRTTRTPTTQTLPPLPKVASSHFMNLQVHLNTMSGGIIKQYNRIPVEIKNMLPSNTAYKQLYEES